MKRLITVAIMVTFILGTVGVAMAVHQPAEFKTGARGDWQISVNAVKNPTFDDDSDRNEFQAVQRLRTAFELAVNENVTGVFRLHTENRWGESGHTIGASKGTADTTDAIGYDLAYVDFFIPQTDINLRVGKQLHTLPAALGSHIIDNFAYSVVASTPFTDMVGLTLAWARGADENADLSDQFDLFYAVVPVTLDGIQINPFFAYGMFGSDYDVGRNAYGGAFDGLEDEFAEQMWPELTPAQQDAIGTEEDLADLIWDESFATNRSSDVWWAGLNVTVDLLDPFVIMGDFNYGEQGRNRDDIRGVATRGWMAALALEYNMDLFTPRLYGFYESGHDSDSADPDNRGKVMPNLGTGDLWGISSFGFNGSQFRGDGRARINAIQPGAAWGASGKWGVGLRLSDITFIDQVSHVFQAAYYQGTNHRDLRDTDRFFTTRDSAWEVNFNTNYQMYENLAAILELGYMGVDLSDGPDGSLGEDRADDDAWKAAAGIRFRF